jgi:tetratricopeptide (TPR) repeat protein
MLDFLEVSISKLGAYMSEIHKNMTDPSQVFIYPLEEERITPSNQDLSKAHYLLAKIHYDKGDLGLAETYFLRSMGYMESPRDVFAKLKILGFLIRISSEKLENERAMEYISLAEENMEHSQRSLGSLNAEYFYNLAVIKNYSGSFNEARENFELAYKKSKEENEPELLAKCLLALSTNYFNCQDYQEALTGLDHLKELLTILNKNYLNGAMNYQYGKIFMALERYDDAMGYFSRANYYLQDKKCWNLLGYIQMGKGQIYKKKGDYEKALLYFKFAQDSIDRNHFKRLSSLIDQEIQDVSDSSIDFYLDRANRKVHERSLGTIDFKHRFVLLEILYLLAKNPGVFFDKDKLAKAIWKDEYNPLIHDKLIYTSVSRLRKLIEPKRERQDGEKRISHRTYIIRGKDGYTFNPEVKIRFHMEPKTMVKKPIGNVDLGSPV